MRAKQVVVIGASAGGIEALRELVSGLPADFPAPMCIVLHTSPEAPGVLDAILSRVGPLPAVNVHGRQRMQPGHIYVAPPDPSSSWIGNPLRSNRERHPGYP